MNRFLYYTRILFLIQSRDPSVHLFIRFKVIRSGGNRIFFLIKIVKEGSLEGRYRIVSPPVFPLAKLGISKSYYVFQWASGYLGSEFILYL